MDSPILDVEDLHKAHFGVPLWRYRDSCSSVGADETCPQRLCKHALGRRASRARSRISNSHQTRCSETQPEAQSDVFVLGHCGRAPQKIHFAHLKHGFFHQNRGTSLFTRQCSGVKCKDLCVGSVVFSTKAKVNKGAAR